ncbi:MAG TPA: hypothetical protein VMR49_01065 [Candidatus Paceibacterota bacterium]|nr:hypothetical protein [Candidatus Paceibacterota bacterium]
MTKKTKRNLIIIIPLILIMLSVRLILVLNKPHNIETTQTSQVIYNNTQYGFNFSLPVNWKGYSIIAKEWKGNIVDSQPSQSIKGPEIFIRNPLWTQDNPYQDIPIMVFTYDQWNLIEQEKLAVSAAPIGPSELGRNAKYIFALPARYNFAFPAGFEEVEKIIESKPLSAF